MLVIVGAGLLINSVWSASDVLGSSSDFSGNTLLSETNTRRASEKQPPLTIDAQLTAAAQAKAEDMARANYWAHNSPDGKTPWIFIAASGYQYQTAGENLAYGFSNAADAVTGWMNSPEHRANILNTDYQNVGFGVASSPNYQGQGPETIVVAEYAKPADAAAMVTFTVPPPTAAATGQHVRSADSTELSSRPVSRIQLVTDGHAAWSLAAVSALAGAALALFITRHSLRLHRVLVRGETYITRHPLLDIAIVFIFTAGFVLTRASGVIR